MKSGNELLLLACLVAGFAFALAAVPALRRLAPRLGLIDHPTNRKRHDGAVPLVGGLAMFTAFVLAQLALGPTESAPGLFLAGAATFVLMGALDDRRPMSSRLRLALQTLVLIAVAIGGGNLLESLGPLLGPWPIGLGLLAVPFTVFGLLGVLNALNFVDGADGLAGGIAFTVLAAFAAVFVFIDRDDALGAGAASVPVMLFTLLGAVAGFLAFNLRTPWRRRATVFMGDAGSLFLGFVIGWVAIYACSRFGAGSLSPVAALWILIVPLFDTISCMVRRRLDGHSPLRADRQHVHHLLQRTGMSPARAVGLLIFANGCGGAIGVAGWRYGVPDHIMFYALIALFAVYLAAVRLTWQRLRRQLLSPMRVVRVYPGGAALPALERDGEPGRRAPVRRKPAMRGAVAS